MLRQLKTKDIYKMSKILKKINIKIDVKDKTQEQLGSEILKNIAENLYLAEDDANEFLSDLAGITKEEFEELEIDKTYEIIQEFKKLKGVNDFLSRAGKLI
jgi:hypothetical protein